MNRIRLQRRRIFLGCEGESEQSYGSLLHHLVDARGHLNIEPVVLQPGGGDPLAIVERAFYIIQRKERAYGERYFYRGVLLDRDTYGQNPGRDQQIQGLIIAAKLHLIWQHPTHEAFLLRHLPGCQKLRPRNTAEAIARLREHWSGYEKGAPMTYLRARLNLDNIRAACTVEPELESFLKAINYF